VAAQLLKSGFFVELDLSDKKLQKKIRDAQLSQFNYIVVIGNQEQDSKTLNVRTREGEVQGQKSLPDFIQELNNQVKRFK
jgi:threonyl-tRNA synthetase